MALRAMNRPAAALVGAIALFVAGPLALLAGQRPDAPPAAPIELAPIALSPAGSIDGALTRHLFGGGLPVSPASAENDVFEEAADEAPPQVVGVVGRLPDQVVVLVRRASGGVRTLGTGDSVAGWRLAAIAADAVLFVRGDRRERVAVASGEP